MKIRNWIFVGAACSLICAGSARALTKKEDSVIYGKLLSAGHGTVSVKENGGKTLSVVTDARFTKLVIDGHEAPLDPAKLTSGKIVRIYYKEKGGKKTARFITLDPPMPKQPESSSPSPAK